MPTEHFKFRQMEPCLTPQKERLTKDVRYQEFNEVTPDRMCGQGLLHPWGHQKRSDFVLDTIAEICYSVGELRE